MSHQLLEPITDPSIAPSFKTNRRLPFNASDLRMAASSGMIVCSALLINNGSQAAAEINTQPCEQPSNSAGVEKHCSKAVQHSTAASPEQLSNHQWSDQLQSHEQLDKLPSQMEAAYADLLNQAQAAASRDQLTEAVNTVAGIPKNSQHYELVQQLQEEWSQELVRQATSHIQQAEITPAIALLNSIPETSQWHDRGTELKQRWSQQAKLFNQAVAAKSAADWQGVIDAIKSLEGSPLYNSLPVQELLQQAMTKRYEPDAALLQIATADAPMMPTVVPPETVKITKTGFRYSNPK
ncbi:hypothetical protein C7B65_19675 [Phormidesmis priestleyi ULC007]|uniref:Uncharacterized protein n=1 Tax=Phormidesmis priestleyi ULC007 TaxID=1920490 RepID=A0A2T1D9N2_9CYAN|nr:hypothetical protein [Phormidesmis priestleyi]PSB17131.1 hypothetical protein C7B65_19675 [Phormidesmis priestleyi ULC007]PZO47461.1 MAG: hypothetical protein DCF14_19750 [Phormidesmis priestleyi]